MILLYKVSNDTLVPVDSGRIAYEDMIQGWIEQRPEILGLDLLIIGREVPTTHGGFIDLLGIDSDGDIAILELKRDRTPREIIAQVLDYASWVVTLKSPKIHDIALKYLKRDLELVFRERFGATLPDSLNENHKMVIIASSFDASSQRIVRYLSEAHDIAINTAFFSVFEDNGQTLIATDWLLDQTEVAERSEAKAKLSTMDLLELANLRKVAKLVEICRQLSTETDEKAAAAYGGSLRYWLKGKMIVGVNIAGGRRSPPSGELDVWFPVTKVAELLALSAEKIRDALRRDFAASDAGTTECIVRLRSPEEAQKLVTLVRNWIASSPQVTN